MTEEQFFKSLQVDIEESIKDSEINQLKEELKREKIKRLELEVRLEEEIQENASLRSGDNYERGAE